MGTGLFLMDGKVNNIYYLDRKGELCLSKIDKIFKV
jgi:hypothetical protein